MTKKTMAQELANLTGLPFAKSAKAAAALIKMIGDHLMRGEAVTLSGLATIQIVVSPPRKVRNPRTGAKSLAPPRPRLRIRMAQGLRRKAELSPGIAEKITRAAARFDREAPPPGAPADSSASACAISPQPAASASPAISPAAAAQNEALKRKAQTIAKVMMKDVFIYYPDLIQNVRAGGNPEEVLGDILRSARWTLAERLGRDLAGEKDYIAEALDQLLQASQT